MSTRTMKTREEVRPLSDIPAVIKLTGKPDRRIRKQLTVHFDEPAPQDNLPALSVTTESRIPAVGGFTRQSAVEIPKSVSWGSVIAAQAACLILLGAVFFMPHQIGRSGWWTGLKAGSLAFALPGVLKLFEIGAGVAGFVIIPLLRGGERGRLMLNIGLSLTALLILAMLEQKLIGIYLVILPIAGLFSLAALYAVLQARTLSQRTDHLGMWQLVASAGVIVMWLLPTLQGISDPTFGRIFAAMGGFIFQGVFALGGLCALFSGVVAMAESQGVFSLSLNRIARALTVAAFLAISAVGATAALSVSEVLAGPAITKGWFGVGVMWLFMLIIACVVLTWAGLTQQFCRAAVNGHYQQPGRTPILTALPT